MPVIETSDGTVWGYGRVGLKVGKPVIVHHGLVGDGTFGAIWDELGKSAGVDWIMIERPGYGGTLPMEMVSISDWPAMIEPVLDVLGITGAFDVVGTSAGAPYAYACAARMPDRVGRVAVMSGVPFLHVPGVLDAYPPDGRAAYARYVSASETELRDEFRAFCQNAVAQVSAAGEIADDRMTSALDAILSKDAAGPAREARLQAIDWGFGPEAITCPVHIWHFEGDTMVPFEAVRRSAEHLQQITRHFVKGDAHIASEAMLKEMTAILAGAD